MKPSSKTADKKETIEKREQGSHLPLKPFA